MLTPVFLVLALAAGAGLWLRDVRRRPDSSAGARVARLWLLVGAFRLGAFWLAHLAERTGSALVLISYFLVVFAWPEIALLSDLPRSASWPWLVSAGLGLGSLVGAATLELVMVVARRRFGPGCRPGA